MQEKRILIVGGGFGGVQAALTLSREHLPNTSITLVSDKHHFEYTPALYKLATGASPLETCIPLADIFAGTKVSIVIDTIASGNTADKVLIGASGAQFTYDILILALGAESAYFNIPGIKENAYSIKTVGQALRLKRHLHELFDTCEGLNKGQLMSQFQFVVIGGGPAGVELAGVIRKYVRVLAEKHNVPEKLVTVDIIQAAPRLLPMMSERVSKLVLRQLTELGINVILNRTVVSEDNRGVYLKDIAFNAKTIIWTAGVRPSSVYQTIRGLSLDTKSGKVLVGALLDAQGTQDVYVLGDSAATPYAGTAQTAIYDGSFVARAIVAQLAGTKLPAYTPRRTPYVIPVGSGWAVFTYKNIAVAGRIFWWLRELIDLRYFLSILPLQKAWTVWREGGILCESCPTCESNTY
jgi:NADH dehydrogenase